jgi:DDE superfamily endonuclease
MKLLTTFDDLLQNWRGVFPQERTFDRTRRLTYGMLTCLRAHRTSTAICASGRQFQDWSADYRVCSRSPWEPRQLFDVVLDRLPGLLPSPEAPVFAALDDTILKKTGRRIPGVKILRDPLSPPFRVNFCYGLRFVQASVLVSSLGAAGPARALPVRFDFAPPANKPKKDASPEDKARYRKEQKALSMSQVGLKAIASLRASLDERPETSQRWLIVSGDGSYTNQTVMRGLPERTTYIGRIRKDAKLYYPLPPQSGKSPGRPRRYGPVAPTPEQILDDDSIALVSVKCFAAGQLREIPVKVLASGVCWRKTGADLPVQIVVIKALGYRLRKGSKLLYRRPAFLVCTDPGLDLATLIQAYINRWEIECNHRDEKSLLGVAHGQVWNPNSVRRLPQLQVAGYSLLLLASILSSGFLRTDEYLPLPKWRRKSIRPSLLDLLALLRHQIFASATEAPLLKFDDFADTQTPDAKSTKLPMAPETLCTLAA